MKISSLLTLGFWGSVFSLGLYHLCKPNRNFGTYHCWLCQTENKFILPSHLGKFNSECSYCGLSCDFVYRGTQSFGIQSKPGEIALTKDALV